LVTTVLVQPEWNRQRQGRAATGDFIMLDLLGTSVKGGIHVGRFGVEFH